MNFVRSINLSLKYKRFTPSGWKDIGVKIFEFATKRLNSFCFTLPKIYGSHIIALASITKPHFYSFNVELLENKPKSLNIYND